ncbi:hypothetical protein P3X46_022185 [Hevea brasiliensis]|uniref:F-box domain-containing protein n=1 Tax=Hevea brasiliensis TaxID=3981 RepID=A0ABQ9LLQ7_HEVBR|nr:hypothetical protein P3X46_022185 [Hevea brasiliensis]
MTTTTFCSSRSVSDSISELPNDIINQILMRLPQKDAVRTCILSTKWRYKWLAVPQLVFDYPSNYKLSPTEKNKLATAIYQALLLHHGHLIKFSFSVTDLDHKNSSDMNHWLHFLSKKGIEDFCLRIWTGEHHKLPYHFYSFQNLRILNLYNCVFKPPNTFRGFDKLVSLELRNVVFAPERFGIFVSNCPFLEKLTLENCPHFFCLRLSSPILKYLSFLVSISLNGMAEIAKYFKDKKTSNLIEMASSIPAIEELAVENYFLKFLAMGGVQNRLTKTLQHLRILHLSGICFEKIEEVSCALCLIRSSPNLEKLTIKALRETNVVMKAVVEHLRVEDFLDCSLDQLRVAKMQLISGVRPELEFMKFLLATSTRLEKFEILPIQGKSFNCGFQRLKELIRFRRASAKAEIIYLDPDDLDK